MARLTRACPNAVHPRLQSIVLAISVAVLPHAVPDIVSPGRPEKEARRATTGNESPQLRHVPSRYQYAQRQRIYPVTVFHFEFQTRSNHASSLNCLDMHGSGQYGVAIWHWKPAKAYRSVYKTRRGSPCILYHDQQHFHSIHYLYYTPFFQHQP